MSYQYTQIDGQRVEVNVARAFKALAEDFHKETGCTLHVEEGGGTRTSEEQEYFYNGWVKRLPGFSLAAPPGRSNHEENGPRGPRALDVYDSGRDPGVKTIGTHRSNVLVRLAKKHGFTPAGHYFNPREGWHYEYVGALAKATASNPFGIPTAIGLQKIARLYGYGGALDDVWGAGSAGGFASFLRQNWGYVGNDVLGPVQWAAIARWLRARWGYVGNDVPGPVMRAALQRAEAANRKEL